MEQQLVTIFLSAMHALSNDSDKLQIWNMNLLCYLSMRCVLFQFIRKHVRDRIQAEWRILHTWNHGRLGRFQNNWNYDTWARFLCVQCNEIIARWHDFSCSKIVPVWFDFSFSEINPGGRLLCTCFMSPLM